MFLCLCNYFSVPLGLMGMNIWFPLLLFFCGRSLVGRGGSLGLAFEGYSLLLSSLLFSYPRM